MNIWEAATLEARAVEESTKSGDKYVFFMGSKSSGKTTLVLQFLARDESAKPTTALEYTFARKSSSIQSKMTGHIWELGGGTLLTKLMDIPITADTLKELSLVLVVDLSEPNKLWHSTEVLLRAARDRVDHVIKQTSKRDPELASNTQAAAWERVGGKERKDAYSINPFPVPLYLIGSKFDLFHEMAAEDRKMIQQCMRFIAHANGATLLFTSSKIEPTIRALRHVISVAVFDGTLNTTPTIDDQKPLYIPAGMDNIDMIGVGGGSTEALKASSRNPKEMWKTVFCSRFEQQDDKEQSGDQDPGQERQFSEPKIDELRAQKDRELEAYRRQEAQKWTDHLN